MHSSHMQGQGLNESSEKYSLDKWGELHTNSVQGRGDWHPPSARSGANANLLRPLPLPSPSCSLPPLSTLSTPTGIVQQTQAHEHQHQQQQQHFGRSISPTVSGPRPPMDPPRSSSNSNSTPSLLRWPGVGLLIIVLMAFLALILVPDIVFGTRTGLR